LGEIRKGVKRNKWGKYDPEKVLIKIKKNMAKIRGSIVVNIDRCKGCEICMVSCPTGTIAMAKEVNSKGYNYAYPANPDLCIGCANCAIVCPDGVITVYKTKI
jgi:2-oxoglutarate ferredoxin oxidoreductase subunit delta